MAKPTIMYMIFGPPPYNNSYAAMREYNGILYLARVQFARTAHSPTIYTTKKAALAAIKRTKRFIVRENYDAWKGTYSIVPIEIPSNKQPQ